MVAINSLVSRISQFQRGIDEVAQPQQQVEAAPVQAQPASFDGGLQSFRDGFELPFRRLAPGRDGFDPPRGVLHPFPPLGNPPVGHTRPKSGPAGALGGD